MKDRILKGIMIIILSSIILIFIASIFYDKGNADESLDSKIERFCYENELAKDYEFGDFGKDNGYRCTRILQAIYRFETGNLRSYVGNNIFNFRSPSCKKSWVDNYGCEIRKGFLTFPTKNDGIRFAVDRYYRVDYRKNITQIISGGCYHNLQGVYVCFNGFTHTSEHWGNYIDYVKKYFNKK